MSKKIIIIIISILALIVAIVLGITLFRGGDNGGDVNKTFDNFMPFGIPEDGGDTALPDNTKEDADLSQKEEVAVLPVLRQLSSSPTAGAIAMQKMVESDEGQKEVLVARYMERTTGHVYETTVETLKNTRITNTTIPKVYEALWGDKGESMIIRYINENTNAIESFSARVMKQEEGASEGTLEGAFLQSGIKEIALSPTKGTIFYLTPGGDGTIGVRSKIDGTDKVQVFDFPFTEWLAQWATNKNIFLTSKASNDVSGFLYTLSTTGGPLKKVLGDISGLTTLVNGSGTKVLYSESTVNGLSVGVYDIAKAESKKLGITTLPEKCIWASDHVTIYCGVPETLPQGKYPDIWYQGLMSFSDTIWKVNTETAYSEVLVKPTESLNIDLDIIKPFLDEDEGYLFFTNKKDYSLWALKIK
ncbi:MAG: hypothetical protein NUV42_02640 [Candidatus Yonathbacteria bacterium]|nr:hypothetical protein [Candidatus Yonathbacteria bacterium]